MIKQKRASPNCRPGWGRALLLLPLEVPRRVGCAGGIGRAWGKGGFLLYFCGFFGFVTLTYSSKNETGRSLKGKKTTINRACGTFTAPRGFITELPCCRCPEPIPVALQASWWPRAGWERAAGAAPSRSSWLVGSCPAEAFQGSRGRGGKQSFSAPRKTQAPS